MGRYWGMDRDKRWERTERALDAMTGRGEPVTGTALEAAERSHAAGKTDEFVEPVILDRDACMRDGDAVIFFNFRADRARQLSKLILDGKKFKPSAYVMMTCYDVALPAPFAFEPNEPRNTFGEVLEARSLQQFRIAETEKYAHVTFFFNGGREAAFRGEDRVMIPSPRDCATYDIRPEMSAREVADSAVERIDSGRYDFVLMNFANADMVGHTGKYEAVLQAMAALDRCLERVIGAAERGGYHTILTADHGNAEEMVDCDGKPHTQHTLNPVPAIWIAPGTAVAPRSSREAMRDGTLADIMPTLCELMRIPGPREMTGKSLLPKGTVC
jgi:2,3-bisphosphoglycerate-independent phosphoglycerate mutase